MSLGELGNRAVSVLTHKKGKMHVSGSFPTVCIVEKNVLGGRGEVLGASYNVSNLHEVVVDYVCEVVGGIAVSLDEDLVLELGVVHGNLTEYRVCVRGHALGRHLLSDNEGDAVCEILLDLFFREVSAVTVISAGCILFMELFKSLLGAEAIVCCAEVDELLCVLHIDGLSVALYVRTVVTANVGTFIPKKTGDIKCGFDYVCCALYQSFTVGIFDSQNKSTVAVLGNKVRIERSPKVSDVHITCRAGCKSCYCHFLSPEK